MSRVSEATLKAYFNTGLVPTETQFANLIDSTFGSRIQTISATGGVTIADDEDDIYIISANGGDRDVTLPTASDNSDRIIKILKGDGNTNILTIKGEAAGETINGISGTTGVVLAAKYDMIEVVCNGSIWFVLQHSIVGDSGWIDNTDLDFDNKNLDLNHKLAVNLAQLDVKIFFGSSSSGADAQQPMDVHFNDPGGSAETQGLYIYENSTNTVRVQTGNDGILVLRDVDGEAIVMPVQFYRVISSCHYVCISFSFILSCPRINPTESINLLIL